ncbi:MAG TPA: dolichyl-phosphate beta-glucosyltransferase [Bryobacteraceae bacterium]|jgi:dolichyl-phosphate beta-glucosyltransferase|nr:dolichyl-phosphate beta-glucosyltransferase [Bryobacteraceae bacterium]
MSVSIDLTLILPAYNERATIGETLDASIAYFLSRGIQAEIIVAADGDDGTRELVAQKAVGKTDLKVIGRPSRGGKGRAIREAVALARGQIIGYADADGKVPIEDYERIEPALREGYRVVTGSRGLAESKILRRQPWYRRIGAKGFYYYMQTVVGLPGISDTQCGFKFFERKAALQLFRFQKIDGYMFDVEILALARRFEFAIKEVPVRWRDDGDSRLRLLSGNARNAIDIFKVRYALSRLDNRAVAFQMAMLETQDALMLGEASCVHLSPVRGSSSAAAS